MSDEIISEEKKKGRPSIDEVTTLIWTKEMGKRLAVIRMEKLLTQDELGVLFGVSQGAISKIESGKTSDDEGRSKVQRQMTVAKMKDVFQNAAFSYIAFGSYPDRYDAGRISNAYWDHRLRVQRVNKGPYSQSRILDGRQGRRSKV